MFRRPKQLRQWAASLLLCWLLGLGTGVANACLATGVAAPLRATAGQVVAALDAHHQAASHDHAQGHAAAAPTHPDDTPVHQGRLALTNCQDFCAKATVSIPPLKSPPDDAQSHAVFATATVTVLPMPAFASVQAWVPRREGVRAPAIPIAFLRLAL